MKEATFTLPLVWPLVAPGIQLRRLLAMLAAMRFGERLRQNICLLRPTQSPVIIFVLIVKQEGRQGVAFLALTELERQILRLHARGLE